MNYPTHRLTPQERAARDEKIAGFLRLRYPHKTIAARLGVSLVIIKEVARKTRLHNSRAASSDYMDSGDIA